MLRLPPRLRISIGAVAASVVAISIGVAVMRPVHTALFAAPLYAEQLSEVEERLASWNVPFTPTADNVLVDASRRSDVLLKLSMAGVPRRHLATSDEVLGKLGALTPQNVVDAQTRSALADDIAMALRGVQGIQDARVIIAPAKTATFAEDEPHDASASVQLTMQPGSAPGSDQIAGIRAFVAASVPGLTPSAVTILDDRGIALADTHGADDQNDRQRALQSALDSALGPGEAIVRVHVDYDTRSVASKVVRRSPVSTMPIAAVMQNERYSGQGKRYDRSSQQLDRGSETRETNVATQGARTARITAAVFVDAASSADLAQIRELAAATLGLDERRGDALQVAAVTFERSRAVKKDAWWLAYGAIVPLLPTVAVIVALLVAIRTCAPHAGRVMQAMVSRASLERAARSVSGYEPARVRGALRDEPPHAAAAIISALPAATAAAVLDLYPEQERSAIVRRMQRPQAPFDAEVERFLENA